MLTIFVILGLLAVLLTLWWHLVKRVWALGPTGLRQLEARTADGWSLAVWHRPAEVRRFREPVVLCHGLGNNHRLFEFLPQASLARALSRLGFEVFSVDLRGVGQSRPPHEGPHEATVDDLIVFDVPAVVQAVLRDAGAERLFWVGHSMGGMVALAGLPGLAPHVAGLCTIGTPIFFERRSLFLHALRLGGLAGPWGQVPVQWPAELAAPFAGVSQPPLARISIHFENVTRPALRALMASVMAPIFTGVFRQLAGFIERDVFESLRHEDYRARVQAAPYPLLVMGGTADQIAPPTAQERLHALAAGPDKTLVLLGRAHGQAEDYGHGDLIVGTHAPAEVYPRVGEWLTRRATSV